MAKYLWQVSYTAQGAQGLQKEGGSARRTLVKRLLEQAGGKESFYFALGESDVYVIADLPDTKTATAVSLPTGPSPTAGSRFSTRLTSSPACRTTSSGWFSAATRSTTCSP